MTEWAPSAPRRSAFETACEKAFAGAQCYVYGVAGGSVVLDFAVVQYADAIKGLPIADQFADPTVMTAFRAAVLAATGSTFEREPTIVAVTGITTTGSRLFFSPLSGGAIAGVVIMCAVLFAATLAVGVWLGKRQAGKNASSAV